MKRMLGIFMALMLLVAPAIAQGAAVEGDWELISIVIEGFTYDNLEQQGMSMTMRLEADGTGVQTLNGEATPCTWEEVDGEIRIDEGNGSMAYTLQADGTLLGKDAVGDSMLFARVVATDSVAGAWKLTGAEREGVITDASTLNVELEMVLNADGTGMLASGDTKASCTWSQSGTTLTVEEENCDPRLFTLQSDGTLTWIVNGVTLIMSRTESVATETSEPAESTVTETSEPAESAAIVSEYGFRVQLPENWVVVDSEFVAQVIDSVGEQIASASGFDQNLLDQLAATNTSMYYAPDMSANFNVVREPAGNVTMDNFASLEPSYQESYKNVWGVTDFELSGPVEINGKSYYVGTLTGLNGNEQKQYFCVANSYIYTITLTNVSESDAQRIMESFEIL